jgi:hypothetical protein
MVKYSRGQCVYGWFTLLQDKVARFNELLSFLFFFVVGVRGFQESECFHI